jgi:6-O-methylguanine DNA methyltransferase, DNA binding domain
MSTSRSTPAPPLAALADFLDHTARGLQALAADLRPLEAEYATGNGMPNLDELGLGSRQRTIVHVDGLATDRGLTTGEVAKLTGQQDAANTHTALLALAKRGIIEHLDQERPARWRLAALYRGLADPYLIMASHVRWGEWTTYGDISIAVRGDTKAARAVGRAAATLEHFPNPHRVLWNGGRIPPT